VEEDDEMRMERDRDRVVRYIGLLKMAADSNRISLTIKGPKEMYNVTIDKTANVLALKEKVKEQAHTPVEEQKLVWKGTCQLIFRPHPTRRRNTRRPSGA
jgi:hypothetical protein